MTLVDSNVLLDVLLDDPDWSGASVRALATCRAKGDLVINSIVYSEVSIGFQTIEEVERVVRGMHLRLAALPREALFLAGKAFVTYRRRGGVRSSPLPDFFIGAHAAVTRMPLLTRDSRRLATYFPAVDLITP